MESTRLDLSGLCVQSNNGHLFSKVIDSHQLVQRMRAGEGRIEVKLSLQYLHHLRFNFTPSLLQMVIIYVIQDTTD
jgi:hypothetical protein